MLMHFSGLGKGPLGKITFAALALYVQSGLSLVLPGESAVTCCWGARAKDPWAGGSWSQVRSPPCGDLLLEHRCVRLRMF